MGGGEWRSGLLALGMIETWKKAVPLVAIAILREVAHELRH